MDEQTLQRLPYLWFVMSMRIMLLHALGLGSGNLRLEDFIIHHREVKLGRLLAFWREVGNGIDLAKQDIDRLLSWTTFSAQELLEKNPYKLHNIDLKLRKANTERFATLAEIWEERCRQRFRSTSRWSTPAG